MSKKNINIDDLFSQSLSNYKVEAPLRKAHTNNSTILGLGKTTFWVALSSIVAVTAGTIIYFSVPNNSVELNNTVKKVTPVKNTITISQPKASVSIEENEHKAEINTQPEASTNIEPQAIIITESNPQQKETKNNSNNSQKSTKTKKSAIRIIQEKTMYFEEWEEGENGTKKKVINSYTTTERDTIFKK